MASRLNSLNKLVRGYDRNLYFTQNKDGVYCLYRKSLKSFDLRPQSYLILALTDNWTLHGNPVEWGLEPVLRQIILMDTWKPEFHSSMMKNREKEKESEDRALKNKIRDVAYEVRNDFAKATNDIIVQK